MRPLGAIVALGLVTGCSSTIAPIYYSMNRHAPLLKTPGEMHVGAHVNGERGLALEISRVVAKSGVVLLTFSRATHDPCATCDVDTHDYGEIAIGKLRGTAGDRVLARFVGIGAGTTAGSGCGFSFGDCLDYTRAEGSFGRAFVQFDRPRRTGRLSTALSVRASAVYFGSYGRQQVGATVPFSPATSFGHIPVLGGFGLTMNW